MRGTPPPPISSPFPVHILCPFLLLFTCLFLFSPSAPRGLSLALVPSTSSSGTSLHLSASSHLSSSCAHSSHRLYLTSLPCRQPFTNCLPSLFLFPLFIVSSIKSIFTIQVFFEQLLYQNILWWQLRFKRWCSVCYLSSVSVSVLYKSAKCHCKSMVLRYSGEVICETSVYSFNNPFPLLHEQTKRGRGQRDENMTQVFLVAGHNQCRGHQGEKRRKSQV